MSLKNINQTSQEGISFCLEAKGELPSGREWLWYAEAGVEIITGVNDKGFYNTDLRRDDPEYEKCMEIEQQYNRMYEELRENITNIAWEVAQDWGYDKATKADIADMLVDDNGNPIVYTDNDIESEIFDIFDNYLDIRHEILNNIADTLGIPNDPDQRDALTDLFWDDIGKDVQHEVVNTIKSIEPACGWPLEVEDSWERDY